MSASAARGGASARLRASWQRSSLASPEVVAPVLVAVVLAVAVVAPVVPAWIPPGAVLLPLLAGGMLLRTRPLAWLFAAAALALGYDVAVLGFDVVRPGAIAVVAVTAGFAWLLASSREELGVQGLRGESMLVDLRQRLRVQGELPDLPPRWGSEVVQRSAGGAAFGGDFVVSALTGRDRYLELALVDVSGKGVDAGVRALLLSGALGGIIGSLPPGEFLAAANRYLLRQEWGEGFATAVHVSVDLHTGEYVVDSAGHPPAVQFAAGSGRWRLVEAAGPMLGLLDDVAYDGEVGRLLPGDALLLYTDGLVEVPGRDLEVGIDKLLGEAERLVTRGFRDGAARLIDAVAPDASDDRALLLLWRSA